MNYVSTYSTNIVTFYIKTSSDLFLLKIILSFSEMKIQEMERII